jgi:MtrB/PioB family decaheme-associated outer membrane protein
MNSNSRKLAVSMLALAVQGALAAMPLAARAQDMPDAATLTNPTNFVELGATYTSKDSNKFGEYNGLHDKGGSFLGNFGVQGGDAFGQGSGTQRWSLKGYDLGTTSRELGATVEDQGHWSLGIGYDQLRHMLTDGYQTPYQGNMGGNSFVLPPTFGVINTTTTTTAGVLTSTNKGTQTLLNSQLQSFRTVDIYSERQNGSFNAGYDFGPHLNLRFSYNRLEQSGAKPISAATDAFNPGPGGYNYGGERIVLLMTPTSYKTDTFSLAANWTGDKGYATASYVASLFHDDYTGFSFSNPYVSGGTGNAPVPPTGTNPGAAFPVDTMSTPPSNQVHQLNLTGGYALSSATRLAGGLSYSRNTQDESYAGSYTTTPNTMPLLPVNSLGALVESTHADLKLSHQATRALNLSAGLIYNERNNKTAARTYTFLDLGGGAQTVTNIPMSHKRTQLQLAGDYRLNASQRLHVGYEYEDFKRWCNDPAANNAQGVLSATNTGYYTTASCVQVPENKDNKLDLGYRLKASDAVDVKLDYTYSRRTADVNPSFYNPMQANNQGFENFGYVAFFDASRKENAYKAGVNWQANAKLNLGLSGRYTKDDYDSTLGVQQGDAKSLNLDASYSVSENSTVAAYGTWQKRTRDLLTANGRNAVAPLTTLWTNALADEDTTVGVSGKQKGLMGGKLELNEDLTYSLGKAGYSTAVLYTLTGNAAIGNLSYGDTPDIRSEMTRLRISGTYQLDKAAQVVVGYLYQHLKADDYYYNAYQTGFTPTTLLPTNQQAPNYSVNVVYAAYRYTFK